MVIKALQASHLVISGTVPPGAVELGAVIGVNIAIVLPGLQMVLGAVKGSEFGGGAAVGSVGGIVGEYLVPGGGSLPGAVHGHIALQSQKVLTFLGNQPVVENALGGIGLSQSGDAGIVAVEEGIFLRAQGLGAGGHAVDLQNLQALGHLHVGGIVEHGVADGVGGIVVAADGFDELSHFPRHHGGGGLHHGNAVHYQLFHHHLAAGGGVALEGRNGQILPAHLAPIGDVSGIDVPHLLGGEGADGIVLIHHEYQGLGGDLLQLIGEGGLRHLLEHFTFGLGGNDQVAFPAAQVAEGLGGAVEGDQGRGILPAFSQQHAGDALPQRHHGGGAIQLGEILPGEPESFLRFRPRQQGKEEHQNKSKCTQSFHKIAPLSSDEFIVWVNCCLSYTPFVGRGHDPAET